MNAKHQFKYTYNEIDYEEYSPLEVTFEMPAEVSLTQMLNNFEQYLRACGFYFDGHLEIVDDTLDNIDTAEEVYGCMGDFDKDVVDESEDLSWDEGCGCLGDSITPKEYQKQRLKEWNEGIAKLDKEAKEQREIRENVSKRADELKQMEERWNKLSNDEKAKCLEKALKKSGVNLEPEDNCWNS